MRNGLRPTAVASDLWACLGLPSELFDDYYNRNGWGETWAALLHMVRVRSGARVCDELNDEGEHCVLLEHSPSTPHYGALDVGNGEPLPSSGC